MWYSLWKMDTLNMTPNNRRFSFTETSNPSIFEPSTQTSNHLNMITSASYHIRLLALILLLIGIGWLMHNLVLSYQSFNPSYWSHYLKQELLSPLLCILGSIVLRGASTPIATWLIKKL